MLLLEARRRSISSKNHGISRDRIFCSRNASFCNGIMQVTQGKGVDIVVNSFLDLLTRFVAMCCQVRQDDGDWKADILEHGHVALGHVPA